MRTGILSDENVIKDCAEYQSLPLNTQIRARPKHIKALTDSVQKIQRQQQGLSSINETGLALNQYRRTNQQNLVTMPLPTPINIYLGLTPLQERKMKVLENLSKDQQLAVGYALQIDTTNAESQHSTTENAAKAVDDYLRAIVNTDITAREIELLVSKKYPPQTPPPRLGVQTIPNFEAYIKDTFGDADYFSSSSSSSSSNGNGNGNDSNLKPLINYGAILKHLEITNAQKAEQGRTGEPNNDPRPPADSTRSQASSSRDHGARAAVASTPQQQASVKKQGIQTPDTGKRH